jgi:hypothetical protein
VHVAYDDFAGGPRAQVATSTPTGFGFFHRDAEPPDFTIDSSAGLEAPQTSNPGLRLAVDRRSGVLYALYQRSTGLVQPKTVTYLLNRSLDGGRTWGLGGSPDGVVIDTVRSDQAPGYKFGTVNALLGGVDHLAIGPFGEVYVVYGADLAGTGVGNQLLLRRVTTDFWGRVRIGAARVVSSASSAALPSVAVTRDGTVGVLYDSFDGFSNSGYPSFTAHLQRFPAFGEHETSDIVLEQFLSPATDDGSPRQRVLGDFQEVVASDRSFLGTFAGNRVPLGGDLSVIDPIFFSAPG